MHVEHSAWSCLLAKYVERLLGTIVYMSNPLPSRP
jgi:hypothetical protein